MKDSIHWKFRPILRGCFTSPPKGTPPLKGYTRSPYMYPKNMKLPGGVVLLFSPWAYPLHVPRLQFLIQLQRTFAPSKVEVEVFLPEIFEDHQIIFHKKLRLFLLFTYFVFPFWGKGIFVFFCEIPVFAPNVSIHFGDFLKTIHFHLLSVWGWKDFLSLSIIYHEPPESLKYSEIHVCLYKTTMAKLTSPKNVQKPLYRSTLLAHDFALMPTNPAKNWKRLDLFGIFGKDSCTKKTSSVRGHQDPIGEMPTRFGQNRLSINDDGYAKDLQAPPKASSFFASSAIATVMRCKDSCRMSSRVNEFASEWVREWIHNHPLRFVSIFGPEKKKHGNSLFKSGKRFHTHRAHPNAPQVIKGPNLCLEAKWWPLFWLELGPFFGGFFRPKIEDISRFQVFISYITGGS